jgi:hypothetical protein
MHANRTASTVCRRSGDSHSSESEDSHCRFELAEPAEAAEQSLVDGLDRSAAALRAVWFLANHYAGGAGAADL